MSTLLIEGTGFLRASLTRGRGSPRPRHGIALRSRALHPLARNPRKPFGTVMRHDDGGKRACQISSRSELADALAAVAKGDVRAFERVYAATSPKLYGIVLRIVGRADLADDILQEVYLRLWQRAAEFDAGQASPITWLAAIARNRALDEVRRKLPRSLEDCPEALQVARCDDSIAVEEQDEGWRQLQASLNRLEPEKREILFLAYHHGLTREEIAQRLGRPVSTIKTWLRRSLQQIKDHLEP